jgi:long-chain fatty acid transport protein
VGGLGWDSVLSVAVGVQYTVAEDLKVRAGYCWSENPIPGDVQYANVVAPLFIQHVASVGFTYTFKSTGTDVSFAWSHAFENKVGGVGKAPGNVYYVRNSVSAETIFVALTQRF